MSLIDDIVHVFYTYLSGTYQPTMFIIGMEIGILAMNYVDQEIFGELNDFFLKWHLLFLGPIVLGSALCPLTKRIFPNGETPNIFISIISLIHISLFYSIPEISTGILALICIVFIIEKVNTIIQIIFSVLFGYSFYFLYNYAPNEYGIYLYFMSLGFSAIAILSQYQSYSPKDDSNNYHSLLVRNLGFVFFDAIVHFYGHTQYGVVSAFFGNLVINYISQLMISYGITFRFR
ncbi:hypothetical protein TRFO_18709 [Tritrichomonas foetus]|uniref:Uncharacterized protein n=1 Tax=Tritrichomonas foetus TaxID=1144522 RepID=A0A1J4KKH0_9EUKA|nr:hypothetical protein TRFO_18709 [Tritrichomonas foetus]|eukprot:OHT11801.1 hypothetical protein TRFO_18709 [Tritrichomonas foetus]